MAKLSEKTIDELNDKINFNEASNAVDHLREARACLNDELIRNLKNLIKKLDLVTDGYDGEADDELFDIAEEIESEIMEAQEHLEKITDVLGDIMECLPDPDDEFENEKHE